MCPMMPGYTIFRLIQRIQDPPNLDTRPPRSGFRKTRATVSQAHIRNGPIRKPLPVVKKFIINRCIANNNRQRWRKYCITYPNPSTKRNMEVRWKRQAWYRHHPRNGSPYGTRWEEKAPLLWPSGGDFRNQQLRRTFSLPFPSAASKSTPPLISQ